MKVFLTETVQGRDVSGIRLSDGKTASVLQPGEGYEVSASLGAWLLASNKARSVEVEKVVEAPEDHAYLDSSLNLVTDDPQAVAASQNVKKPRRGK